MSKKILAVALAAAMILGLASVAFAASFSDTVDHERETAIKQLAGLGLLDGYPDGTFRPENPITRAEFAKVMVYALGLADAAEMLAGVPVPFADVEANHWAVGFISIATSQEIVKGYPDGTFGPQNNVTYAEVLTMLLRALGYGPVLDKGPWPTAYLTKAADLKINRGISFLANAPATRGDVAALVANAVSTPKLVPIAWGPDGNPTQYGVSGVATDDAITLLHDMGAESEDGWLIASPELFDNDDAEITLLDKDGNENTLPLAEGVDLTGLIGHKVRAWLNDEDEVFFVEDITNPADVAEAKYASSTTVNIGSKKGVRVDGATLFRNYKKVGVIGSGAGLTNDAEITVIFDKGDAKYVVAFEYEWGVVDTVNAKYSRVTFLKCSDTQAVRFDHDNVTWQGAAAELEDLQKGDVVQYIEDDDNAVVVVTRDSVTGEFTKLVGTKTVTIDGTSYTSIDDVDPKLIGELVTAIFNKYGDIVYLTAEEDSPVVANYGVIYAKADALPDVWGNTVYQLKLLLADGTKSTFTVDEDALGDDPSTAWGALTEGSVVEYSTDSDGVITDIDQIPELEYDDGDDTTIDVDKDLAVVENYKVTSNTIVFLVKTTTSPSVSSVSPSVSSVSALLAKDRPGLKGKVFGESGRAKIVVVYEELEADTATGMGMVYDSYRTTINGKLTWVVRILANGTITDYITDADAKQDLTATTGWEGFDKKKVVSFTVTGEDTIKKTDITFKTADWAHEGVQDSVYWEFRVLDVDLENNLIAVQRVDKTDGEELTVTGDDADKFKVQYFWVDEKTLYYDVTGTAISIDLEEVGKWAKVSVYLGTDGEVDVLVVHGK